MSESAMRATMWRQPDELRRLLADGDTTVRAAEQLADRRVLLAGTGTSWHAANHGTWMLRAAGVEAWAIQPMDVAVGGVTPGQGDALILLSHTGIKRYSAQLRETAHAAGVPTLAIGGIDQPGVDLPTVERERELGEQLSAFPLTVAVQRIALELAEALGTDADAFGYDVPGRRASWERLTL